MEKNGKNGKNGKKSNLMKIIINYKSVE